MRKVTDFAWYLLISFLYKKRLLTTAAASKIISFISRLDLSQYICCFVVYLQNNATSFLFL